MTSVSLIGLFAMVCGMVGLLIGGRLFSTAPLAIALQLAAVGLMIWARTTFGLRSFHASAAPTVGGIVTTGPYRWIRHPIYTAVCLFAFGGAASHPGAGAWILLAVTLAGAFLRMLAEESLLRKRYPEYEEYARRTRRMIPFVL
jgi:protein-S-isoprenylcysteine O-methyltransferase Ste14